MTRRISSLAIGCAAAAIVFGLTHASGFAQRPMASPVPMPNITMPQAAPSVPQAAPSHNSIPEVEQPAQAQTAPELPQAAPPRGTHYTSDGKLGLNPGCRWLSDAPDDIRTDC